MILVSLALVATALLGCNEDGANGVPAPPAALHIDAGDGGPEGPSYPAGPYGVQAGSVIADYLFSGFPNAKVQSDTLVPIHLSDFYNPHADDPSYKPADAAHDDRLYPPGSPYGEALPKPKAMSIDIASVWCGPCNIEAKMDLPPLHVKYRPQGGEFLLQLADSLTAGNPATQKDLYNWTKQYKVDYPATIDPTYKLSALFDANSFPANLIVDLRTMKIVLVVQGVPDAGYWAQFESVLAGK
jgi:hypothetical protein